jgi:hypothetical protein
MCTIVSELKIEGGEIKPEENVSLGILGEMLRNVKLFLLHSLLNKHGAQQGDREMAIVTFWLNNILQGVKVLKGSFLYL